MNLVVAGSANCNQESFIAQDALRVRQVMRYSCFIFFADVANASRFRDHLIAEVSPLFGRIFFSHLSFKKGI